MITKNFTKKIGSKFSKGPFIYYVITFLGFLEPPPPLRQHVFSTNNKQKLAFSDPPPYKCWRNIWMVPYSLHKDKTFQGSTQWGQTL